MLHLRRSFLRALPNPTSGYQAARGSQSFVTLIKEYRTQPHTVSLSRPQRDANISRVLRRFYAAKEGTFESVKETAEQVQESAVNTAQSLKDSVSSSTGEAQETLADQAERAQSGARNATDTARDTFESLKGGAESAIGAVSGAASSASSYDSSPTGTTQKSGSSYGAEGGESTQLYLGNLYFDVDAETLKKEFSPYGKVVRAVVIKDARGLSKGFGYIEFEDQADATKVRDTFNGQLFEGRRLVARYALKNVKNSGSDRQGSHRSFRAQEGFRNPPGKTLYIGNMSFEMSDNDLNELFREVKNVLDVRVAIDRRTGQPRGFAHADFIDVKSAEAAAEFLMSKEFYGRQLRVDYSTGGVRAGGEGSSATDASS